MKRVTGPLLLVHLASEFCNVFNVYIVWHYAGSMAIQHLAVAFPICFFVSIAIPRAIS